MHSIRGSRLARRAGVFVLGGLLTAAALASSTTLTVGNATATVTGPSPVTAGFPASIAGALNFDAYLSYQTADGTAVAGTDYTAASGVVRVPAGATTATIPVTALGSSVPKSTRSFTLNATGAIGAGPQPAFGTALNVAFGGAYDLSNVAFADIDGDGRPDLIVADVTSVTVSLNTTAPGATTPSFGPAQSVLSGSGLLAVSAADLNGDGRPDLVVTDSSGNAVLVLINTGAAGASLSFAAAQSLAVGSAPVGPASIADVNNDGLPDILIPNSQGGSVSVLVNGTAPGAATASFSSLSVPTGANPVALKVADINGDGRPDLLVASAASGAQVILNSTANGSATPGFGAPQTLATGATASSLALADLNNDGKPDLLVINNDGSGNVLALLNTTAPGASTASFAAPLVSSIGVTGSCGSVSVSAADLNGDGKPDVLATCAGNGPAGSLSVLVNATTPGAATAALAPAQVSSLGLGPVSLALADLNGDGKPDLAAADSGGNSVLVLLNATPASAAPASFAKVNAGGIGVEPFAMVTADFNGDGKPDIAMSDAGGEAVQFAFNTSTGGVGSFANAGGVGTGGDDPLGLAVGDFNGDGKPDVVVPNYGSNSITIMFNNTATGAATANFARVAVIGVGALPQSTAVADFNGDGKPDIAVVNSENNNVEILLNNTVQGSATANFTAAAVVGAGNTPIWVAAADFNGDGKPDLAILDNGSSSVLILLNTTVPGSSTPTFVVGGSGPVGGGPQMLAIGDFNGDGKPDVAVPNQGSNSISVLLNQTEPGSMTASLVPGATISIGSYTSWVSVADIDGDGRPDIVVTSPGNNTIPILLNQTVPGATTASFKLLSSPGVGSEPSALAIADFSGSGLQDLAVIGDNFNFPQTGSYVLLANQQYALSAATAAPATGTIQYSVAEIALSPSSLDFGDQRVGSSSAAQTVQLSNPGNAALSLGSIATTGDFSQTNNCPASLPGGSQCGISITFTPSATGTRSGTLTVPSSVSSGSVALTGTGIAPQVQFSASTLAFGQQPLGVASTAQTVTLSNPGNATLDIASIITSGDFTQTNTCGLMLTAGASCTLSVSFTPTAIGARSGTLTLLSDAASSPDVITLGGTGTGPVVQFSPSALSFPGTYVDLSSTPQSLTLSNTGNGNLVISGLSISGNFAQTSNCPGTVAPGSSCSIQVSFTPLSSGALAGQLSLSSNAAGSLTVVSISGTGLKHGTSLTVNSGLAELGPSAVLQQTTPTVAPLAGKTVTFTTNSGSPICTATTDANGTARCGVLSILGILLGGGYQGSYAGDVEYNAATGAGQLL